jgi:hypothetical protein
LNKLVTGIPGTLYIPCNLGTSQSTITNSDLRNATPHGPLPDKASYPPPIGRQTQYSPQIST